MERWRKKKGRGFAPFPHKWYKISPWSLKWLMMECIRAIAWHDNTVGARKGSHTWVRNVNVAWRPRLHSLHDIQKNKYSGDGRRASSKPNNLRFFDADATLFIAHAFVFVVNKPWSSNIRTRMQRFKIRLLSRDRGGAHYAQSECKTKNRLFMFSTTAPCNK